MELTQKVARLQELSRRGTSIARAAAALNRRASSVAKLQDVTEFRCRHAGGQGGFHALDTKAAFTSRHKLTVPVRAFSCRPISSSGARARASDDCAAPDDVRHDPRGTTSDS